MEFLSPRIPIVVITPTSLSLFLFYTTYMQPYPILWLLVLDFEVLVSDRSRTQELPDASQMHVQINHQQTLITTYLLKAICNQSKNLCKR